MWYGRGEVIERSVGDGILIGGGYFVSGSNMLLEGDVVVFIMRFFKI